MEVGPRRKQHEPHQGVYDLDYLLQLKGRVCAIESGGGNKGKGKATSPSTPRGSGDPWTAAGADPWQQYNPGAQNQHRAPIVNLTPSAPTANNCSLSARLGDRTTVIVGGFPRDTCRSDLEQGLRIIVDGYEGVLRVGALGKYGAAGRINFKDPDIMWIFIEANKGGGGEEV